MTGGFLQYWAPYDPPYQRNLAGPHGAVVLDDTVDRIRTGPLAVLESLRQPERFTTSATDLNPRAAQDLNECLVRAGRLDDLLALSL